MDLRYGYHLSEARQGEGRGQCQKLDRARGEDSEAFDEERDKDDV